MKHVSLKKLCGLFLAVFVLAALPVQFSSAAATPGAVTTLKAKNVTRTKATLSWSKVSNATGYYVYQVNEDGKIIKQVGNPVKGLSCKVSIKPGQTYSYQVFAYKEKSGKILKAEKGSPIVNVDAQMLRLVCYGNKCAFLEWDTIKNARYYNLYQYNSSTGTYKAVANKIKTDHYTVSKLKVGKSYSYVVRSVRKVNGKEVESEESNILKVKGKKVQSVHGRRFVGIVKKNIKVTDLDTGKSFTLKKGTKVSTSSFSSSKKTVTVIKNGKRVKLSGKYLKNPQQLSLAKSYKEYTKAQAEAYVNSKGFTSKTKYLIWVSQYTASVHYFTGSQGRWKQIRAVPCIVGSDRGFTKTGQYELLFHGDWNYVYFTWSEKKEWGDAFHGYIDGRTWGSYSAGCVRVSFAEWKYILSLPLGTKVISF